MTEMQREMQNRISQEELDRAFDARFPKKMQEKLRNAKVAVAGLGGLGSHIAVMLARSGVGELLLVDFDVVDVTNLNRQMYFIPQLGKPKAEALPEILRQINPYLIYESVCVKVIPENVKELFSDYSIVCEAFDKPDVKAMLTEQILCYYPEKTLICGSGMAGYGSSNTIKTRKINDHFYICGDGVSGAMPGRGLMAPRVTICAAHEANMVLRCVLGLDADEI